MGPPVCEGVVITLGVSVSTHSDVRTSDNPFDQAIQGLMLSLRVRPRVPGAAQSSRGRFVENLLPS